MAFKQGSISEQCKKMETLGVTEGGSLRPSSDAESPDLHEVKVIRQAKQFVEAEESNRTDSFVDAEKKISDLDQKLDVINTSCDSILSHDLLEGAFQTALSKEEFTLIGSCARELEARSALNRYRTINQIHDPAHYPSDQLWHMSFLILFIAIETVVNAWFYEGASGLIGGAVVALSVSVTNMFIAAGLGFTYRYVNLPSTKDKVTGYAGLIAFIVLAFVLNLIFATFRVQYELLQNELLEKNLAAATPTMLIHALKTAVGEAFRVFVFEFPQIDMNSLILFLVGVVFSIIAFWKGYTLDDKHPGYGAMDRRHKAAENEYKEAKDRAFNAAVAKVHEVADQVEQLRASLISSQKNSNALKAQIQSAQATFDANVRKIQGELNLVIESYRGANKATRAVPPPKYFNELPVVTPAEDTKRVEELLGSVETLSEKSKSIADEKVSLLSLKLQAIQKKINELIQDEFQKYLAYILEKANQSLKLQGHSHIPGQEQSR